MIAARLRSYAGIAGGETVIFLVALLARVGAVLSSGGYSGSLGYDDSVYYAAADALVHGRMPYRDFTLLHPPGIMLALSPFAGLGTATSDRFGFMIANLAFAVLGAVNAVLVVAVARRMGLARPAALIAGCCYALYVGAVIAEYSSRLEPLGNFLALCGLLAFFSKDRASRIAPLLCGFAFGAATSVKMWWSVPLLVMVIACAWRPRRSAPLYALGGAALAMVLIVGPFFLAAPHNMVQMVLRDQLSRPRQSSNLLMRLGQLSSVSPLGPHLPMSTMVVVSAIGLLVVLVGAGVLAWQLPRARPVVALGAAQLVVLCAAPSFIYFYPDYFTVGATLTIGAAASRLYQLKSATRSHPLVGGAARTVAWLPALVMATTLATAYAQGRMSGSARIPGLADVAASVVGDRCVMADTPMALISVNVLSRDFADGCPNWVDVTGRSYGGRDKPHRPFEDKSTDPRWQFDVRRYLTSGNAVILGRRGKTGIDAATMHYLRHAGVLERNGPLVVYNAKAPRAKF
jgi:alpha-1,2-mannosyltransferase